MAADTTVEFARRCRHCGAVLSATSSFCSKCGATNEVVDVGADPLREQVRTLFGADLDIERELGRGGMAVVFAGFDPALQRRVAVKVLLPEIANDRSMADRFLREARTVASLQHPHVVTVYLVRSLDGVHAIVMQFKKDAVLTWCSLSRRSCRCTSPACC
ncbi:MAG: inactive serine/threonine-protein kinase VRK3 [Gemmatimonadetes bacterium]|nr:inactive serine/threonine-protein kinase VRK3 [Gemmatimonadota bacterium]